MLHVIGDMRQVTCDRWRYVTETQTDGHSDSAQRTKSLKTIIHSCLYIEFTRIFLFLPLLAMPRTFIESLAFHCNRIYDIGIICILGNKGIFFGNIGFQ